VPLPAADVIRDLPAPLARVLEDVVDRARSALGDTLRSVVLFGSAAENRLRATSDVNLLIVVSSFDPNRVRDMAPALQGAHAAVRLGVMWLAEEEIVAASESFAVKFADIVRRHRVLHGADPFAGLRISRDAALVRVRQVLLNLVLRLRAGLVLEHDREERIVAMVAEAAGPLRAGAAELLDLEGAPAPTAREALERLASEWSPQTAPGLLASIGTARETRRLDPGDGRAALIDLIALAGYLHRRARALT
jgi:predicted nucleotidyltransferase